ncbi:MAG TPA: hypothetical protein PKW05_06685 [Anaerolineae bacterium]|nr:hypothetical protein [Anaerolineae bacterium]
MRAESLEILRQYAFLTSLLAGFALTAASELVGLGTRARLATVAIALFLLSPLLSVVYTCLSVMVLARLLAPPGYLSASEEWVTHLLGGIGVLPFAGVMLFLTGIGLVGWLRSRALRAFSTLTAGRSLYLLVYLMWTSGM